MCCVVAIFHYYYHPSSILPAAFLRQKFRKTFLLSTCRGNCPNPYDGWLIQYNRLGRIAMHLTYEKLVANRLQGIHTK